jgi:hypothetical protein
MILLVVGIAMVTGAIGLLWVMLPKDGQPHRLATAPVLESVIPLTIVTGFAVGLALIFSILTH